MPWTYSAKPLVCLGGECRGDFCYRGQWIIHSLITLPPPNPTLSSKHPGTPQFEKFPPLHANVAYDVEPHRENLAHNLVGKRVEVTMISAVMKEGLLGIYSSGKTRF